MKTIRLPDPLYRNDIVFSEESNDPQYQKPFKVEENTARQNNLLSILLWIELTISKIAC